MAVFTTDGRVLLLDIIVGDQPPLIVEVGLFVNDIALSSSTLLSDLLEPSGDYGRASSASWSREQITEAPIMAGTQTNFVITGWSGLVYGYFLVVGNRLISADKFDLPFNMDGAVQSLGVIPKLSLSN